jgi:glycosyltransferase involved in cell wall biosynthesis
MDVVQVTHKYPPSIGGIENYAARLTESLREGGHSVSVVTTDCGLPDGQSLPQKPGVTYCETTASVSRNPISIDLYRSLRDSDADVYHLHSPYLLPMAEAVSALPRDAVSVLTVHGFPTYHGRRATLRNLAYKPIAQYIFNRVDRTIVLGESERARLLDRYDIPTDAVSVIPNGIEPDRCDVGAGEIDTFRWEHGLHPKTPTILFVGRLVPSKNPDALIEAVVEELPEVDLDVVLIGDGDPEYVAELRERADGRFTFIPGLPWEELLPAYGAADLFTLLSKSEGLSTVVLEAMNARLPVISTSVGALSDVLTHGETGWILASPPRPAEVGTAIREYLGHPDLRRRVGRHNRARVREEYDWTDIASEIESLYRELTDEGQYVPFQWEAPSIDGSSG